MQKKKHPLSIWKFLSFLMIMVLSCNQSSVKNNDIRANSTEYWPQASSTPLSDPTITPLPPKFRAGQEVFFYFHDPGDGSSSGRKVSGSEFLKNSEPENPEKITCEDLEKRYSKDFTVYHSVLSTIVDVKNCGGVYYFYLHINYARDNSQAISRLSDYIWVTEDWLSDSPMPIYGFTFALTLEKDVKNPRSDTSYLPEEIVYTVGEMALTEFDGSMAELVLESINEDNRLCFERCVQTNFSIHNLSNTTIEFSTQDVFWGKRDDRMGNSFYVLELEESSVTVAPDEKASFSMIWEFGRSINIYEYFEDHLYIVVNNSLPPYHNVPNITVDEHAAIIYIYFPEKEK